MTTTRTLSVEPARSDPARQPRLPTLVRLAALLAIEVAAVVMLHQLGRYRWLRVDWSDLGRWLDQTPPEDALVTAVRMVALVVAWWLIASTIAYAVLGLARAPKGLRPIRRLTLPLIQRIVDGALALSLTRGVVADMTTLALPAAAAPADPHLDTQPAGEIRPDARMRVAIYQAIHPLPDPASDTDIYTVQPGDTLASIAEDRLGDPDRWPEIWQANRARLEAAGYTDPGLLHIGWELQLPLWSPSPSPPADVEQETYTVQPGDNFWTIAEDQLTQAWGRRPTSGEVAPYWEALMEANRDRLPDQGDPDLIYPGQLFVLPPVISSRIAPEQATPGHHPEQAPPDTNDSTQPAPAPAPVPDTPETPHEPVEEPAASNPPPPVDDNQNPEAPGPTPASPPSSTTPATTDDSARGADTREPAASRRPLPSIGVTAILGSLVLAALALWRKTRRRSNRPQARLRPRPAEDVETERSLAAISDNEVLAVLAQTNRALGVAFKDLTDPPTVTGLVITPTGDVTVHMAEPAAPQAPFTLADDGMSWYLPADEANKHTDLEDSDARPVLFSIVSLGRTTTDGWVLVDLEALGVLEIGGPVRSADNMCRSITTELALQPLAHLVDIMASGIDLPKKATQGTVKRTALDETIARRVERHAADTVDLLADHGLHTTIAARAKGVARDGLASIVVVAAKDSDPVLLDRITQAALPGGHGVALICVDPLEADTYRIVLADDTQAQVPHLGLTIQPAHLDADQFDRIDSILANEPDVFESATDPGEEPSPLAPLASPADVDHHHTGTAESVALRPYEPPEWRYCIRIFAGHQVETPDGTTVSFRYGENPDVTHKNTHRGPELLTYLTLQPNRSATLERIKEDLWWGRPIADGTVDRLVYGTRGVIGGSDLLSQARDDPQQRFRLSAQVVTDVELLEHALTYARGAAASDNGWQLGHDVLEPHLSRVETPPFDADHLGRGLADWATAHRIPERVERPLIEAALLLAQLTENQPEHIPDALWALDQALTVTPTNEALVRAAMHLEDRLGNRDAANQRYLALAKQLTVTETEPEPATTELRHQIMTNDRRIG